jgi:GNAT superfamily N-acetyltransferase
VSEIDEVDVATVTRWQVAAVVTTLAEAFVADPFFVWMFPDHRCRVGQVNRWWDRMVRQRPAGSKTWQAAEVTAAALWHPPIEAVAGGDGSFAPWFVDLVDDSALVAERFEVFGRIVDAHPSEPHWYLAGVGTRPAHQGRGLGRAVLEPMMHRCDDDQRAAYLESSNPLNVPFYERFGFTVVGAVPLPGDSGSVTLMARSPR